MNQQLKQKIEELLASSKVFMFIKGTPDEPKCGFTMRFVGLFQHLGVEYKYFDVLSDEEMRQGIKEYANWPTFPMLFVNKELVGGFDITTELFKSGELQKILSK